MANILPDLKLQKPLEDYVEYFDHLTPRSINLIEKYADMSIAFQDPHYNVRGLDSMLKILRRRFDCYPSAKYAVHDFVWGRRAATAYLRWTFSYLAKPLDKERVSIGGMTEVGFSPTGKICSHIEFWQDERIFQAKGFQKPL